MGMQGTHHMSLLTQEEVHLDLSGHLGLSTSLINWQLLVNFLLCTGSSVDENTTRQGNSSANSSIVDNTALVFNAADNGSRTVLHTTLTHPVYPLHQHPIEKLKLGLFLLSGQNSLIQDYFRQLQELSWKKGTYKQYGSYFKKWMLFCGRKFCSPFLPDVNMI